MESDLLRISVTCRENSECIFDNKDLTLDLMVANNSSHDIGFPLEHMRKKGIHCFLVDNESNRKITLDVSLTPEEIKKEFVKLPPGGQINLSQKIGADLILFMRNKMVDLTVNLAITGVMEVHQGEEPVRFLKEAEIRIVGRDRFLLENRE